VLHSRRMSSSSSHSTPGKDFITNPVYNHLPQNVYHSSSSFSSHRRHY
jgi:hypothetical protein